MKRNGPPPRPRPGQPAARSVVDASKTGSTCSSSSLAFISRFWDLGVKGLHHDESLHAVYSDHYYTGLGYIHSPMMHGPLQFHYIDFFYTLFGATNDTARYASAVCGIFVVMSPFFLRRQLGRWPALIATLPVPDLAQHHVLQPHGPRRRDRRLHRGAAGRRAVALHLRAPARGTSTWPAPGSR